ncbi:MAG: hypothetical protein GXX96_08840 [Planctomycetaceae bacterium]|nr:hypothetical protein [Planctomycetaceae bacterium]
MTYPDRSHPSIRSSGHSTAIAFLLALSAFFGLKGYLGPTPGELPQPRLTAASAPAPALDTIPIGIQGQLFQLTTATISVGISA